MYGKARSAVIVQQHRTNRNDRMAQGWKHMVNNRIDVMVRIALELIISLGCIICILTDSRYLPAYLTFYFIYLITDIIQHKTQTQNENHSRINRKKAGRNTSVF